MLTTEKEIRAYLERVKKDRDLVAVIPRVAAAGFGIIPIERGEGWLQIGTAPQTSARAIASFERLVGLEVRAERIPERVVHLLLNRIYPRSPAINFHTFKSPEFLEDVERSPLLLEEKPHEPIPPVAEPDPETVVLLDYSYQSYMQNLDGTNGPLSFEAGPTDKIFAIESTGDGPAARLTRADPLGPAVVILARESYANHGGSYNHGWRGHEVSRLPFMIHPTELQVTGIEPSGALSFLIYDRVERLEPGETRTFEVVYYFLSFGERLHRRLVLAIHGIHSVPRERLVYGDRDQAWTPDDLRRWLFAEAR